MAGEKHGAVLRDIGRIFDRGSLTGLSEGQILRRFADGDEGAFELLVSRYGPMVRGVCRRALDDPRDVEDAFQATFLVLLKRAGGLRDPEAVGPWLYGVALRVSARIRARVARRPFEERKGARPESVPPDGEMERAELRDLIDAEIQRLPERYRRPVVLCYVEGRTHEEAARRLQCSTGSLRGRLDRAREKLRGRLIRRGVAPAATVGALAIVGEAAAAVVPAAMVAATVATLARAATASAVSGAVSSAVLEAANGVFRGMILARVRLAAGLVVGMVALGALPLVVALEAGGPGQASPAVSRPVGGRIPDGIVVSGRVIDEEGHPIAGARVARGADLRGPEKVLEATTDADGRFVLAGVPAGPLVLTTQAAGHAPELKTMTAGPGLAPVAFRLGAGHSIRGRIVDVHDRPIAGAPIAADEWRGHHSIRWSTRTDAEGRFRWDDAPADVVMIDLGKLGFGGKRFYRATPDAPEWTLPMRRALRVRGRVTDAATGRPVRPFTLVPGYAFDPGGPVSWENDEAKEVSGLSFDEILSTIYPLRLIRIEADGYRPAVSRMMKDDEEEVVLPFTLERGSGVEGVVRGLEGSPLAGAEVLPATSERPVYLNNGRTHPSVNGQRIVRSRADGRFSLPPQEPPYTILAIHDWGYAMQEVKNRAKAPAELTLQSWSRVEGTLRFGSRPGAGQELALWYPGERKVITWGGFAKTDAEGRFAFERVVPGRVNVSRQISFGDVAFGGGSPTAEREVPAGATLRLDLGGTGRPVVGKAVPPAELAGRKDWIYGSGSLIRQPTAAGKAGVSAALPGPNFVFRVEPDGTLRIEDIEAGTYDIRIVVVRRSADGGFRFGADVLAAVRRAVVVPPMPGGRSDEPLDLGTIAVGVMKQSTPTTSAPRP